MEVSTGSDSRRCREAHLGPIDEWSAITLELQPLLADILRRM